MGYGYAGKILHVDLTAGILTVEEPPEEFYRKYLGGSAMGVYYLLREMKPGVDPLGPDNVLTMMLSAPTGAPISGQSRMTANARSPLVDGIGDGQCGGFFPAEMKFAGLDGLVIKGKAARPVYLWLHDGQAEIREADHLWGKTVREVDALLKEDLGDEKVEIAQCGPAGEKLSRLAAIINMGSRANGRTGLGAVMGSKNLKAVAVRGKSKRIPLADSKKLNALARQGVAALEQSIDIKGLQTNGTADVVPFQNLAGTLPTRNYSEGQFEDFEAISGEQMTNTILVSRETCYACTVHCKRAVRTEWLGQAVLPEHGGPEYETVATFGSYCGVNSLDAIAYANQTCNEQGLDTIGTGATIAWAMDCFEQGLLTEAEVGFPLRFGDAHAMTRLMDLLARREGFGAILADGSRKAADKLGKGHELLTTVKGSEAPAHMPQYKRSLGLIYSVNPFGADHQSSEHDPYIEEGASDLALERMKTLGFDHNLPVGSFDEEKFWYALKTQRFYSFLDSADLCQFVFGPAWSLYGPQETVEMIRAVTGWEDFDIDELMEIGERRLNLMRLFNAREGLTRDDDCLPAKFYKPLQGTGPTAGVAFTESEVEQAKDTYYQMAGWDVNTGNPTRARLVALGLDWLEEIPQA